MLVIAAAAAAALVVVVAVAVAANVSATVAPEAVRSGPAAGGVGEWVVASPWRLALLTATARGRLVSWFGYGSGFDTARGVLVIITICAAWTLWWTVLAESGSG